ncbi:MAG: prolyl oligopeptidase family protein [Polyangiales bacterium]
MPRALPIAALALVFAVACGAETPKPVPPSTAIAPSASPPPADSIVVFPTPPARPDYGYPATRRAPVTDTIFGVALTDDYRWLEDGSAPEVKAWLGAQDAFARARLTNLSDRDALAKRLKVLYAQESRSARAREGKRFFFWKREATQEKSVYYVKEGKDGAPRALLDPNAWSTDGSVTLRETYASLDGNWVAYLKSDHNSDEAVLHVVEVKTGKDTAADVIEGAKYAGVAWTPKSEGFYYTWLPPVDGHTVTAADRPGFAEVRFHKLGDDPKRDRLVCEKTGDAKKFSYPALSRDGRWLLHFVEHGWSSTDVYYRDTHKGDQEPFHPLVAGTAFKYWVLPYADHFYVGTDDGAPNRHVYKVDPKSPSRDKWIEIVPERKDATLESVAIVGGALSLGYLKDVTSRLELHGLDGKLIREIVLPALGTASNLIGREDDDEAYFDFGSFTVPDEIHAVSVKTGKTSLYHRQKAPVDPTLYVLEQRFATSKDGARVPYFVVRGKDQKLDATTPALLYAYGGFNVSYTPAFTDWAYPWLERGGILVVGNLRGGGEYGEAWHHAGMRTHKQRVFDDLYAIAEQIVADKYTSSDKLVVRGASNGGLLVATAITQRPELFRVGLCGVPLIDMVRFHLFGSGKTWVEEYGSSESEEDFKAIVAYSPYQHVTDGVHYPSLLLLSADSDDRVDPMHAWKFAAEMQARSAGGRVLLRIEKNSGHGGADRVAATVEKLADQLAFALTELATPRP